MTKEDQQGSVENHPSQPSQAEKRYGGMDGMWLGWINTRLKQTRLNDQSYQLVVRLWLKSHPGWSTRKGQVSTFHRQHDLVYVWETKQSGLDLE